MVILKFVFVLSFVVISWGLWNNRIDAKTFTALFMSLVTVLILLSVPVETSSRLAIAGFEIERTLENAEDVLSRLARSERRLEAAQENLDATTGRIFLNSVAQCNESEIKGWLADGTLYEARSLEDIPASHMAINCYEKDIFELFASNSQVVSLKDSQGNSLLHAVGRQELIGNISSLWRSRSRSLSEVTRYYTRRVDERIRKIVHLGIDPNVRNSDGQTPMMVFAYRALIVPDDGPLDRGVDKVYYSKVIMEKPLISLLEAGASLNLVDSFGWSTLMYLAASHYADESTIEFLIAQSEQLDRRSTVSRRLMTNHRYLSEEQKTANARGQRKELYWPMGVSALMIASRVGTPEIVKALIDGGANVSLKDSRGVAAIDYATENIRNGEKIIQLLESS